jgi:pyruvate/2-oxoglutarate dehydrogenase complex dihydrolipoamide acyltransferase (E2) component
VGVAVATDRGLLVPVIRDAARFVNLIRDLLADPESFTLAV